MVCPQKQSAENKTTHVRGRDRFADRKDGQREVGERRAIGLERFALHEFVELERNQAGDEAGGGRDRRDDLARDQLGLRTRNKISEDEKRQGKTQI
jgi:hypothetical protein